MIRDILRALGQLGDARFRNVLLMGVGLSVGLLAAFSALFVWTLRALIGPSVTLPWFGEVTWLATAAGWLSLPVLLGLSVILMIPVASAFTSLFLDRIADAVEAEHYPRLPAARGVPLGTALRDSLGFLGLMLVANLCALIGYILLAPLAPLIFWAVNGMLLGREYGQMVALRRMDRAQARRWRKSNRVQLWIMGIAAAIPLTIPVVNLLVPVIAVAAFTHAYHRLPPIRE